MVHKTLSKGCIHSIVPCLLSRSPIFKQRSWHVSSLMFRNACSNENDRFDKFRQTEWMFMDLTILANLSHTRQSKISLAELKNFDEFWSNSQRESAWRNWQFWQILVKLVISKISLGQLTIWWILLKFVKKLTWRSWRFWRIFIKFIKAKSAGWIWRFRRIYAIFLAACISLYSGTHFVQIVRYVIKFSKRSFFRCHCIQKAADSFRERHIPKKRLTIKKN